MAKSSQKSNPPVQGPAASGRGAELPEGDEVGAAELTRRVADNLRRLRKQRELLFDVFKELDNFPATTLRRICNDLAMAPGADTG